MENQEQPLHPVEKIKQRSMGLRGTLKESLENETTGALYEDDQTLLKFHGMYQQDDRDKREARSQKKLEPLYSFMIRLRIPGGVMTADQWIASHHIAGDFSTGIIKITTRQTIQLHGILKKKMRPVISSFNKIKLDSIAACGDVNRNVMCSAHPMQSPIHEQVQAYADKISTLLLPKTRAWYEVWLGEKKLVEHTEEDPLYEDRYLPRKFKIAIAIPPNNDVDVFANDIGLIAIIQNDKLIGFNIAVGGGLSTTHGNAATYARVGTVIGFCDFEEKILKVVYEILTVQRDFGNRSDRKQARLKYTIDKMGVPQFVAELEARCGFKLEPEREYAFTHRKDYYGWHTDHNWNWHFTLFVENGRIYDSEELKLKSALLEMAETRKCNFRFTANQNIIIADIKGEDRAILESIVKKYQLEEHNNNASEVRKNSMACVALNTCPLALAEAQRYMPSLISKMDALLEKHALQNEEIIMRMTGCPNGCARPYLAEVGFVGTALGHYNLMLGGDHQGLRLNKLFKNNLDETAILSELDLLFGLFKLERKSKEHFGDFLVRKKIVS